MEIFQMIIIIQQSDGMMEWEGPLLIALLRGRIYRMYIRYTAFSPFYPRTEQVCVDVCTVLNDPKDDPVVVNVLK